MPALTLPVWLRKRGKALITDRFCPLDDDPHWGLPTDFGKRAFLFSNYRVCPFGAMMDYPHRKCHETSIIVATRDVEEADLRLCTGYSKSEGAWFRHSWVINTHDKTLLECTPINFEVYFGVILSARQMERMKKEIGGLL